jgi:hypothetical protein
MIAVRFDPAVIDAVRRLTEADGSEVTVSSWIREAVRREEYRQRVKWLDEHRHELEAVPGPGRLVAPRHIPSRSGFRTVSTGPGRTFCCPHMSIGNVAAFSCGTCGPVLAEAG